MRRWAMILVALTMISFIGTYAYAAEQELLLEDVNSEVQEIVYDGRIEITFVNSESDDFEELYYSSPVQGITINLFFRYNKVMTNVYEVEDFQNVYLNLTSDENGKIIIEGIPYGRYEYNIAYAPEGYIYSTETKVLQVTPSQNEAIKYDAVQTEEYLNSTVEEEIPPVIEELVPPVVETPVEEVPQQEVQYEMPKEEVVEFVKIETQNINVLANEMFKSEDVSEVVKTEEQKQMNEVTKVLKEKYELSRFDMIKAMRTVRITDTIRVAIAQVDNVVHFIDSLSDIPEDDHNKKLLNHRISKLAFEHYREYKNKKYAEIVSKTRR